MQDSQATPLTSLPAVSDDTRLTTTGRFSLGKYREIIIAVGFFLLFDLGVLVLNFYTSFQIGQDAVGINLSGRQRMLSQRTAKALFSFDAARQQGSAGDADLEELRNAVKLFDISLAGFRSGATVPGGNGQPVHLAAAEGPQAAQILDKAFALWDPYKTRLAPVLSGHASPEELLAAVAYAKANNLKLLGLMNELTTALEAVASQRASTLRLVQTGGIVLALLNFVFILFKFLRRLQVADSAAEAANQENREILASVREGLFLITAELRLGTQLSQSTAELFGRPLQPGDDFLQVLAPLISAKDMDDARAYVDLLFQPHVKESLVQSINPLTQVALTVKNRLGQEGRRHLSFQFNRAMVDGVVRHLLVTVQDVSQRVELEAKLQEDRERSRNEFSMLLTAYATDPATLRQFIQRAESSLLEVNELLRSTSNARNEAAILTALDGAARRIHALKGDASMLGLDTLTHLSHQFESDLQRIRDSGGSAKLLGEALLALPMPLEDLLQKVGALQAISRRGITPAAPEALPQVEESLPAQADPSIAPIIPPAASTAPVGEALGQMISKIARELGKQVDCQIELDDVPTLTPSAQDLVREIAVQLARNAVTHGIEPSAERQDGGKPETGRIEVKLQMGSTGGWSLTVRDDGRGISADRVRAKLLQLGWYNQAQLDSLGDRQIVEQIFRSGFSTADGVSLHAGRGVGLDVVVANVRQLGARVRLQSTPGQFTEFSIRSAD